MATILRFIIAFFVLAAQPLFSQPEETLPTGGGSQKLNNNVVNSVERFKNTDFMVKFNDLKQQVEDDARDFIAHRNRYKIQDVRKIQAAYGRTAGRFNQVMLDIKQDFMDKDKIKMINKYPQMYSDGLVSKINSLEEYYTENLLQPMAEITQKDGSAILAILMEIIKASGDLSSYFKGIKYEKQAMSEAYLNKNLIEPTKFKSWQELVSSTPTSTDDPINKGNNGGNNGGNGGNNDNGGNGGNNDNGGNGGNNDNGGNGGNNDNGGNGGNNDNGGNGGNNDNGGNGGNNDNGGNGGINPPSKTKKKPNMEQKVEEPVLELDDNSMVRPNQNKKEKVKKPVKPVEEPKVKKQNEQ